ncbi:MAG: MMPL family transporter, partial [Candidatus Binatia bacterium]|nr:MMPL family transporter [Candidatus Binatia bacterium]
VLPTPTEKEMAKVHRRDKFFKAILARLSDFTLGSTRYAVIGGAGVVLMIGLIGAFRVEVGDMEEGSPLFWADSEYNQAEKILNGSFLGTSPYMLHLRGDKPGALAKPEVVQAVHTLQKHLEERQDVGGTISYMEVVKGINMAWHNNDPRWYVLPLHYQQIWGTMESFRQAGGPDDSKIYYELDFSEGTLAVFVKDHKGKTINSIVQYTDDFLKANVPEDSPVEVRQAAGIIGIYKAIMEKIKEGQTDSMWQISAVVFIFCLLTFRSPVAGLVVLVPLGLGTIITFATMGFGKIGLFIYTVPVASLGIGLGVDYSIYIVSRMKEELSLGKSYEEAHRETIVNAGKAVFFTAMSLALGVAMLLLSDIRFQAILGGMLMVVLLANMLGALVLLPALMSWWRPRFLMVRK